MGDLSAEDEARLLTGVELMKSLFDASPPKRTLALVWLAVMCFNPSSLSDLKEKGGG